MSVSKTLAFATMALAAICSFGCGGAPETPSTPPKPAPSGTAALSGKIQIDGSSSVYPLTEMVQHEFRKLHPDVKITVAQSGTGGGFKRFVKGEIDINDASRRISEKEKAECAKNQIEYLELTIATDAITLIVSKDNDFCECLSVEVLKRLWEPDSKVKNWKDLDDKFPDHEISLFGADADSGTFDFFTEAIVGKAKSSRDDYSRSGNDNDLVVGVAGDKHALGYIPYSYYLQNKDTLKAVGVKAAGSKECVLPSAESVDTGAYTPLARPLYLCVNAKSLERAEVKEFLKFYLTEGQSHVEKLTQLKLKADDLAKSKETLGL